jgi:DNA-binding transcriptional ArsR family regulator
MPELKFSLASASSTARMAHALAHPARLLILELLRDGGAYVMHLTTTLGIHQANVSQHLAVLREAGLIIDERDGMNVFYRVRDPQVFELVEHLKALATRHASRDAARRPSATLRVERQARGCQCPRCSGRQ